MRQPTDHTTYIPDLPGIQQQQSMSSLKLRCWAGDKCIDEAAE